MTQMLTFHLKYGQKVSEQLTKIGKNMTYQLGLFLRDRYDGFIKNVFDTEEIQVISTDYDRTLMSAECVMAAFYRPDDETKFRKDLEWVPTPIHTAPEGDDVLLNVDAACPRISSEVSKLDQIPEIQDFNEKNEELYKFVSEQAGFNETSSLSALITFDAIYIERLYNLTIPKWAVKTYNEMNIVSNFFFELLSYTDELKRLRGGPLLKMITENMTNKSRGELPKRKMNVYSAHDSTVSIILNSMGVYNSIRPPYSSTVMIELHQIGKDYFVKIYYQNDTNLVNSPHELTIPGCSFECPLQDWTELLNDVIPNDWEKECHDIEPLQNQSKYLMLMIRNG
ncbi:Testicular acid phosphatase-like protein [Armadillidium nasatum]|uniref:acid phosphatase n=1 Tax=Armadillidium nasatum TaxID=96803 RepID=A0A5N5T490_9CRUS|nr:Testicular acid phosphatase-like protein [Armadillidium nasatum]